MQQESDFKPDQMPLSHIGDHKPPKRQRQVRVSMHSGIFVVVCLFLLGGGFVAGMQYQKGKVNAPTAASMMQNGQRDGFGGGMRQRSGGLGTVTAVSSSSITITERSFRPDASTDGTSKTYAIDSSTKITSDGAMATTDDIRAGDTVLVRTSSSTSTVATEIRINPSMGRPGGASQSSNQSGSSSNASAI